MAQKKRDNGKKAGKWEKVLWILGILILVITVLLLAAYLVVHSYLKKIDYQNDETAAVMDEQEYPEEYEYEEEETETEPVPDSSEEEIAALEAQLRAQVDDESEAMFSGDVVNILLVGCDSRQKGQNGRSDTILLLSLDKKTQKITMTSFMRDSYVAIPGHMDNRINAAYALGGARLLMDTLETNFKVRVDKYVMIDFYSFVDIVDCVGGLELEVSDAEVKVMNRYIHELNRLNDRPADTYILEKGGNLHLNGTQTLAYARVRYVGNADFERTQRQRTALTKLFEKAKDMNLLEMNNLLNVLLPEVTTNMTEGEVFSLLLKTPTYLTYDLDQLRIPADGAYSSMRIRGMAVLGVDLEKNRKILREQIYGE